ncbi:MAG: hypothetical protein FGM24_08690 [Candidatus Kapabacteria bacterium]|nr:hypothetical protein [Candidatus Kapabacteria bacterium]
MLEGKQPILQQVNRGAIPMYLTQSLHQGAVMKSFGIILVISLILVSCASETVVGPSLGTIAGSVRDPTGARFIPNVQISTTPPTQALLTDTLGKFTISDVTPGTYVLTARYFDSAYATAAVGVQAGKTASANLIMNYGTPTTGIITGIVTNEMEVPVSGAVVTTTPATEPVTTGPDGRYMITNVTPGTYIVNVVGDDLYGAGQVSVDAGKLSVSDITLSIQDPSNGWVTGVVTKQGIPLPGITVEIVSLDKRATTDAEGRYRLSNVAPGEHTLAVVVDQAQIIRLRITALAGKATIRDVETVTTSVDIPTFGLELYMAFKNGSVVDASPKQRKATLIGGTFATDRKGDLKGAFQHDGTPDNAVEIEHSSELNMFPMTMAAWLYIQSDRKALILGKAKHPEGDGYMMFVESKKLVFLYTTDNFASALRAEVNLPLNEWFWAGMSVYSSESGVAYVNGVSYTMVKIGEPRSMTNGHPFRIGSISTTDPTMQQLSGMIDSIILYSRGLPRTELQSIMEAVE